MFWIVIGVVLVVMLGFAWFYDRKSGGDPSSPPSQTRAQAESDQAWTAYQSGGGNNPGL
ncbi:hypothetical protein [Pedococcus sp. 2YAF34]|uniref:hypothetical protein n=1 Tax=Pedococcus sp. 2YAF34 TaxID=3233032 RepID=UPI003F98F397